MLDSDPAELEFQAAPAAGLGQSGMLAVAKDVQPGLRDRRGRAALLEELAHPGAGLGRLGRLPGPGEMPADPRNGGRAAGLGAGDQGWSGSCLRALLHGVLALTKRGRWPGQAIRRSWSGGCLRALLQGVLALTRRGRWPGQAISRSWSCLRTLLQGLLALTRRGRWLGQAISRSWRCLRILLQTMKFVVVLNNLVG